LVGLGLSELEFFFGFLDFADELLNHEGVLGFDKVEQFFPDEDSVVEDFFCFGFGLFFLVLH
jgi:hypothetical protein